MVAIHNMDAKLWARLKLDALRQGIALSAYVQALLRDAMKGGAK